MYKIYAKNYINARRHSKSIPQISYCSEKETDIEIDLGDDIGDFAFLNNFYLRFL